MDAATSKKPRPPSGGNGSNTSLAESVKTLRYFSIALIIFTSYHIPMDIFAALANPPRRKIVELLASRGKLPATAIFLAFKTSPSAVSQHLKVLRDAGIVHVEKNGQRRIYRLNMGTVREVEFWTKKITWLWNKRLGALEEMLKIEKEESLKRERGE